MKTKSLVQNCPLSMFVRHGSLELIKVCFTSAIVLRENGYEDVNIVIQDSVDENLELIERIKKVFTDASRRLFEATENRVYYRKINIIVPKTWTVTRENFFKVPSLFLNGYVTVEKGKIRSPHVKKQGCGKEGQYMYLTPSFLLKTGSTRWGNHESVIVHEWGHLRWGLYDEYKKRRPFYQHAGKWKPVGCTENVEGRVSRVPCKKPQNVTDCDVNNTAKKMDSLCRFCPSISQSTNTSIMSFQFVPSIAMFCDKDEPATPAWKRHNRRAPNRQNKMCKGKSAWEVMREHDDFVNGASPILQKDTDTSPDFDIIQEGDAIRVFVLDVSGSMSGMLETKFGSVKGCEIILMSDGADGNAIQLTTAEQKAISTGVVIHAVSISQAADPRMISLASETGGKHFNYLDQGGISFAAVFSEAVSGLVTGTNNQALTTGEYNVTVTSSNHHTWDYIVKSFPSEPHPILVTSRLSTTQFDFSLESADLPVLYVDITKGKAPVVGANIEAHVEASSNLCTLSPKDNGQDPDSLEGDGTYSVYLLPNCLTNGRLNIRVTVSGKANGTSVITSIDGALAIDESDAEPEIISDSFQRFSLPEPIFIKQFSESLSDMVAPGQITDVDIVNIETRMTSNGESRNFTISWTATGNDMNNGQASSYEIRYADDIDTIVDNFSSAYTLDIGNVSLTPKQSGMMEAIVISVDAEQTYVDTAYLGIVAVDETGNRGKVSNIVSIVVAKGFRVSFEGETNYTENEEETTTSPATTVTHYVSAVRLNVEESHTGLIGGVCVGVLAGILVVVLITFFMLRKRQKKSTYEVSRMGQSSLDVYVNFSYVTEKM
ncbi:calcium-activated chloride channel regulator 2-like [Mya arenaria]|uniref:calcium-activated chloride channel regulator 2-like n=1 Tax=Mya arenaria TaxID=6604 RepID=UPI0022E1DF67|nr:calcium-activated chloride channel regulator 2-like [Mya arenaria]